MVKTTKNICLWHAGFTSALLRSCLLVAALVAFSLRAGALTEADARPAQHAPQAVAWTDEECEYYSQVLGYTEYYCECLNHSLPFHYGVDTMLQGVNWFTSTLNEVSAGFSAYWFSDSYVTIDGFVSCGQDSATMSQKIGANRSYHADIQSLLARFGGSGIGSLADLPLYVRTTQPDWKDGRLIITPFDKGPHSTCENPLPVSYNIPYVVSDPDNVYMMTPMSPNVNGQAIRWVSANNDSVRICVGKGSCTAEPFIEYTLYDSLHVWVLPYDTLRAAWQKKDTLYFHFYTDTRLSEAWFIRPLEFVKDTVDSVVCLGSVLNISGSQFVADTAFADTVYIGYDSLTYRRQLGVTDYSLHFTPPVVEYDTINCHGDSLGFYYLGMRTQQIKQFGDYSVYFRRTGQCDRDIRLHVEEILYPVNVTVDTTLCEGRRLRIAGVNYTRDTVFSISAWQGKQEIITTYILHFTPPELTYDTVRCHYDSLPFNYRGQRITAYGTKTLTIVDKSYQSCTEKVRLTTQQLWYADTLYVDTTLCAGGAFVKAGAEEYQNDRFVYRWSDKSTKHVIYYNVARSAPELEYDSLSLHISRMPYSYFGNVITHYGDTVLGIEGHGKCDRLVALHTEEYVFPITRDTQYVDTTLCKGMSFRLHDSLYVETTQFVDTFWWEEYAVTYTFCNIVVVEPTAEYDTLSVLASSMPLSYEGETVAAFGDHVLVLHNEGACDRTVYLSLTEKEVVYDTVRIDTVLCSGKILYVADTVIFSSVNFSRRQWSTGLDTCFVTLYGVRFEADMPHYDTIQAFFSELPYHYTGYPGGKNLATFGDYMYTYEPVGDCKQTYYVRLVQLWERDTTVFNDTLCAGIGVEQHYTRQEPSNIRQADSVHLFIYNTYVSAPVEYFDTLSVSADSLPVVYEGRSFSTAGDWQITAKDEQGCTVIFNLHLTVRTIDALGSVDGEQKRKKFVRNGQLYILYNGVVYDARGQRIVNVE